MRETYEIKTLMKHVSQTVSSRFSSSVSESDHRRSSSTLLFQTLPRLYLLFDGFRYSGWATFNSFREILSLHLVRDPHLT